MCRVFAVGWPFRCLKSEGLEAPRCPFPHCSFDDLTVVLHEHQAFCVACADDPDRTLLEVVSAFYGFCCLVALVIVCAYVCMLMCVCLAF